MEERINELLVKTIEEQIDWLHKAPRFTIWSGEVFPYFDARDPDDAHFLCLNYEDRPQWAKMYSDLYHKNLTSPVFRVLTKLKEEFSGFDTDLMNKIRESKFYSKLQELEERCSDIDQQLQFIINGAEHTVLCSMKAHCQNKLHMTALKGVSPRDRVEWTLEKQGQMLSDVMRFRHHAFYSVFHPYRKWF